MNKKLIHKSAALAALLTLGMPFATCAMQTGVGLQTDQSNTQLPSFLAYLLLLDSLDDITKQEIQEVTELIKTGSSWDDSKQKTVADLLSRLTTSSLDDQDKSTAKRLLADLIQEKTPKTPASPKKLSPARQYVAENPMKTASLAYSFVSGLRKTEWAQKAALFALKYAGKYATQAALFASTFWKYRYGPEICIPVIATLVEMGLNRIKVGQGKEKTPLYNKIGQMVRKTSSNIAGWFGFGSTTPEKSDSKGGNQSPTPKS